MGYDLTGSSIEFLKIISISAGSFRWTPHPVIVTIRDNRDYIRVLLYSYYTTITGWGVLLTDPGFFLDVCRGTTCLKLAHPMPEALDFKS